MSGTPGSGSALLGALLAIAPRAGTPALSNSPGTAPTLFVALPR